MRPTKSLLPALGMAVYTIIIPSLGSVLAGSLVLLYPQFFQGLGWPGWSFLMVPAALIMGLALIPSSVVLGIGAWFLGFPFLLIYLPAYLLALVTGYYFVRTFERGKLNGIVMENEKAAILLEKLRSGSFGIVLMARLNPALPFSLMNLVFSIAKVPIQSFLLASLVGMLPRTLILSFVASNGKELAETLASDSLPFGWFIGLLAVSVLGIIFVIFRIVSRK